MIPLRDDNPTERTPFVSYGLIAACVLVYLWQASLGREAAQAVVYAFGAVPAVLFGEAPPRLAQALSDLRAMPAGVTVFTSMFMHGGLMHLIGNMLYLWIFADNIEDRMGHARFIVFYLLCGVVALLAHALPNAASQTPMVGASGAISGVLGAYLLLYPRAHVLVLIPLGFLSQLIHLPAIAVLGLWFGLQLLQSLMTPAEAAGVAFGAHIGGFIAGMVLLPVFMLGRRKPRGAKRARVRF